MTTSAMDAVSEHVVFIERPPKTLDRDGACACLTGRQRKHLTHPHRRRSQVASALRQWHFVRTTHLACSWMCVPSSIDEPVAGNWCERFGEFAALCDRVRTLVPQWKGRRHRFDNEFVAFPTG